MKWKQKEGKGRKNSHTKTEGIQKKKGVLKKEDENEKI